MADFRLNLDSHKLNSLFPFHFVLNRNLEIEHCGLSLQKWLQVRKGNRFDQLFSISQPMAITINFESLTACKEQLIILETIDGKNRWIGQMEYCEAEQQLLFLGNPSLISIEELSAKKLTVKDFAIGDPLVEMLQIQQSQKNIEEALRVAKDEVENASMAKQSFLANMSHEIRTPMNGILGIGSLLYKTNLTPKQKQFTKLIIESGNNLLHIVNDILDLSKLQSGQFILESTPFDLGDKILSTLQAFHFKAEDKGIELSFNNKLKKDLIVEGDPYRLGQVLSNLISNALKFTFEGCITVTVEQVTESKNAFFEICVADTGMGISKENLPAIFEQFVQAGADITRKYGGTGLGLSIAKNLVEMQGGTIHVKSEVKKGSVFTVRIPYKLSSESILKKELRKSGGIRSMERKKILVAEDVPVNQLIAKHILKSWGHVVTVAENGKEVLKFLERNNYDLILMDIHMPEMNGVVTTRLIRKLSNTKKSTIPIIAVTAAAFKDETERYLEAGMNEFITKPYTEEKLFEVIRRVLKMTSPDKKTGTEADSEPIKPKEKLYDLSNLLQFGDDDPNFIKDIITLFITNGRQDLSALQAAVTSGEIQEIFQVAHRMKSSLHTMGIRSVETAIKRIDHCSRNNEHTEEIPQLYVQVEGIMLAVFDQLMEDFGMVC